MSDFFTQLINESMLEQWAATLDWLFNDDRFSKTRGWNGTQVCKFTKRVKRMPGFSKDSFICGRLDKISFPNAEMPPRTVEIPTVLMGTGEAEGRALVRHIRNGIAHGKNRCFKIKGELYIEVLDYGKRESTEGNLSNQTAYICIPLAYITQIHSIYQEIEYAERNDRSKKKTA